MAIVSDDVMFCFSFLMDIHLFTCSHLVKEEAYLISHIFRLNKQKVYAVPVPPNASSAITKARPHLLPSFAEF